MIKYNIVLCCYGKILINVAAYIITGSVCVCVCVCVCVWCGVNLCRGLEVRLKYRQKLHSVIEINKTGFTLRPFYQ